MPPEWIQRALDLEQFLRRHWKNCYVKMKIIYPHENPTPNYAVHLEVIVEDRKVIKCQHIFEVSEDYDSLGTALRQLWQGMNDLILKDFIKATLAKNTLSIPSGGDSPSGV